MDPLTAFSLAGTIIQFLDFTTSLVRTTVEIHGSIKGLSSEVSSLEEVYTVLREFSSELVNCERLEGQDLPSEVHGQIISLNRLSTSCKDDCDRLLKIVDKLASGKPSGRWKSFKVAVATLRKHDEIAALDARLSRNQNTLTVCICAISNQFHAHHFQELRQLRAECGRLQMNHNQKLDEAMKELRDIHSAVKSKMSASNSVFTREEVAQIQSELAKLRTAERSISLDQNFLRDLAFDQLEERHTSIPKAHQDTLEWIFAPATGCSDGRKLLRWLESGKGVFWVSGKAGSGKSTLMKFVAGHDNTRSALAQWAGSNEIFVISHYFWWAGSQLQKSQQGLLQTLLFGIFRQCPQLMQDICESRWSQRATILPEQWTVDELRSVFEQISRRTNLGSNFCFFIDGLDEYDGDHMDICSVLQNLGDQSPHFKFCLSSRPWNVFENIFGHKASHKIYVHDLTEDDIRRYAHSRLQEHKRWSAFAGKMLENQRLVSRITERARGVFLWVFLVTRLLREGMNNNDSLTDLFRRLDSFPSDLEAFFKHMLQMIDPFYAPKMSTTLQISLTARGPLLLPIYGFHEDEFENPEYSLNLAVQPLSRNELQISQRINGWCKGFLEVQGETVHFIHRSVVDFLRTREIANLLACKAPPNFCATKSLLKAHHALLKSSKQSRDKVLDDILEYACMDLDTSQAAESTEEVFAILDDTESCLREMQEQGTLHFPGTAQYYFRCKLLTFSFASFLSRRIPQEPEYFLGFEKAPLSVTLDASCPPGTDNEKQRRARWFSTIQCLLENGEDPNEIRGSSKSPWVTLLSHTFTWPSEQPFTSMEPNETFAQLLQGGVFSLFLQHGADPNADMSFPGEGGRLLHSSAWGLFLTLGNNFSTGDQKLQAQYLEDQYLEEVDAFLLSGANAGMLTNGHAIFGNTTATRTTSAMELQILKSEPNQSCEVSRRYEHFKQFLERISQRLVSVTQAQEVEDISDWELVGWYG